MCKQMNMIFGPLCTQLFVNIIDCTVGMEKTAFPRSIWRKWQKMMVQAPQTQSWKNTTTMGKVDTSDLIYKYTSELQLYPFCHLNLYGSIEHIQGHNCKEDKEGILETWLLKLRHTLGIIYPTNIYWFLYIFHRMCSTHVSKVAWW